MKGVKTLTCACCGNSCKGRQHWNRDKGYGCCIPCFHWMVIDRGEPVLEVERAYGRLRQGDRIVGDGHRRQGLQNFTEPLRRASSLGKLATSV